MGKEKREKKKVVDPRTSRAEEARAVQRLKSVSSAVVDGTLRARHLRNVKGPPKLKTPQRLERASNRRIYCPSSNRTESGVSIASPRSPGTLCPAP